MLGSSTIASAQGGGNAFDFANITCPDDVTIECGQNINDPDLTGLPSIEVFVGAGYTFVKSDATISTSSCETVVARTWTAELEEFGGSIGSVSCTQIITVRDTQGPVIRCNFTNQCSVLVSSTGR